MSIILLKGDQNSSTPAPVSSVVVSDPEVVSPQQPAIAGGIQPGSTSEANFWTPISALILVFVLPLIVALAARPASREHPQVSINAQNDIEGAAPSQSQAPELGEATLGAESSRNQEPNGGGPGDRSRPALVSDRPILFPTMKALVVAERCTRCHTYPPKWSR